jgi:hypothetical protein
MKMSSIWPTCAPENSGRRNANDGVGNIFDGDLLTEDAGVEPKAALPVRVADDGDSGGAGPVVFGSIKMRPIWRDVKRMLRLVVWP